MKDTRKKVLLVITKSNWGGAQRYVYQLATQLPKNQYHVSVALGGNGPLKEKLLAAGICVTSIPRLQRNVHIASECRVFFSLFSLFRRERPDILHLNSSKIGALGVLAGRAAGVRRIIFTAHGFAFNEDRSPLAKSILRCIYWFIMAASSQTILVSDGMRRDIRGWLLRRNACVVVHNAATVPPLLPQSDARERLALIHTGLAMWFIEHPDSPLIGTIGELHPIKGHRYAIDAMTRIPDAAFVIIGEGEERERLTEYIKKHKVEDRVFLVGAIHDAAAFLPAFDIFLLPSLSEALAYVVLEAGLAHVPVIATDVGGLSDCITHEKTGLFVPARNADAITSALRRLLNDNVLREHIADGLQKTVARDFSPESFITGTMRAYRGS